jgi:enamine deaminase RidA (YjgF/YER057c/UK114 family)
VFAGDTLYCSAKSAFIPGPNQGVVVATIEQQVRQTARNLLDGLEEADMDFSKVVATNVYLDDIGEFQSMNKIYALFFSGVAPARTTIQQIAPVDRNRPHAEGIYPAIEQISLIAVK